MDSEALNNEQEQNEVSLTGPGKLLKQAREHAGLSQQNLADKLFLKPKQIDDIENDILDDKSSLTFTKGYVKLYAKHVGLDEATVIEAFDKFHAAQQPAPAKLQSFSRRVSKEAHDDRWMMFTYAVGVSIVAGAVWWWYQQSDFSQDMSSLRSPSAVQETVDNQPSDQTLDRPLVQQNIESEPVAEQPDEAQANLNVADSSLVSDEQESLTANEGDIDSQASNSQTSNSQTAVPSVSEETATSSEASTSVTEPGVTDTSEQQQPADIELTATTTQDTGGVTTNDELELANLTDGPLADSQNISDDVTSVITDAVMTPVVFTFADDCWVNIVDATGERIAYGVKKSGRVMSIEGIAPFEVTLGAPQVVEINYDGEVVSLSQFRSGRTARFTLPLQG